MCPRVWSSEWLKFSFLPSICVWLSQEHSSHYLPHQNDIDYLALNVTGKELWQYPSWGANIQLWHLACTKMCADCVVLSTQVIFSPNCPLPTTYVALVGQLKRKYSFLLINSKKFYSTVLYLETNCYTYLYWASEKSEPVVFQSFNTF